MPIPVGAHVDGVAYIQRAAGRRDSAVGFWLINLISAKRHLLCALRKSDECQCGCRAWRALFPLLSCIRWQLEGVARSRRPAAMHSGDPWPQSQSPAVPELSYSAVLLFVK
eukprot:4158910-Pyramimonas_sp.AAC.1